MSITVATLMTVGDVAANRPIGSGSIVMAKELGFTSAFLAVTNIAVAFCQYLDIFPAFTQLTHYSLSLLFLQRHR